VWMDGMFERATSFNRDLSGWNVGKVTRYDSFSTGASSYSQPKPTFGGIEYERMDVIEDSIAENTTTDAPPHHGRNLLSTPCRRRRSAAWLASHPRRVVGQTHNLF